MIQKIEKTRLEVIEKRMDAWRKTGIYLQENVVEDLFHLHRLLSNEREFVGFLKSQNYKNEAIKLSIQNKALRLRVRGLQDEIEALILKGETTKKHRVMKTARELNDVLRERNDRLKREVERLQSILRRKKSEQNLS